MSYVTNHTSEESRLFIPLYRNIWDICLPPAAAAAVKLCTHSCACRQERVAPLRHLNQLYLPQCRAGAEVSAQLSSVSCPLRGWGFPRLGTQMACLSHGARRARQLGECFWAENSLFFQRVWKWTPGELCKWRPLDISSEGKKIPWSSFTLKFSSSSVTSICIERTSVQEKLHMQYKIVVFLLLVGWSTYPHSLLLPLILKANQRN